jgi:hypothetical protein
MDLTLTSYILYGVGGLLASVAVFSYLAVHWGKMPVPTRAFTIFAATNFACDALSKAWFAAWRVMGKPPSMVDHFLVDVVTYGAAVACLGALWFWTRHRFGDWKPVTFAVALAFAIAAFAHL